MWKAELQRQTSHPEIAQEIEDCIQIAKQREAALGTSPQDEDAQEEVVPPPLTDIPDLPDLPGPPSQRLRSRTAMPATLLSLTSIPSAVRSYGLFLQAAYQLVEVS